MALRRTYGKAAIRGRVKPGVAVVSFAVLVAGITAVDLTARSFRDTRRAALSQGLIAATESHDAAAVREVLAQGADPNARPAGDTSGAEFTPLMMAFQPKDEEIFTVLLEQGADARAVSGFGSPVILLGRSDPRYTDAEIKMIENLLRHGANIRDTDLGAHTVLMDPAAQGNNRLIEYLVSKGADVNARDHSGESALDWANDGFRSDTARLLVRLGAKDRSPLVGERPMPMLPGWKRTTARLTGGSEVATYAKEIGNSLVKLDVYATEPNDRVARRRANGGTGPRGYSDDQIAAVKIGQILPAIRSTAVRYAGCVATERRVSLKLRGQTPCQIRVVDFKERGVAYRVALTTPRGTLPPMVASAAQEGWNSLESGLRRAQ